MTSKDQKTDTPVVVSQREIPSRGIVEARPVREALRLVADALADVFEQQTVAKPIEQSDVCPGPSHSERKTARRRAPRMPPVVRSELEVTAHNRDRARQALLRRGYALPPEEEPGQ